MMNEDLTSVSVGEELVRRGYVWRIDELGRREDWSAHAVATGRGGQPTGPMRALLRPMWKDYGPREWFPVEDLAVRGFKRVQRSAAA